MNNKPVNHPNNDTKTKPQTTVKYPELSDSELEVVCGGNEAFCDNTSLKLFKSLIK